jgi:hypothetical protein
VVLPGGRRNGRPHHQIDVNRRVAPSGEYGRRAANDKDIGVLSRLARKRIEERLDTRAIGYLAHATAR